jgi:hypothetical protein
MAARHQVLADHKRRGKTLLAPFNHMIGPLREVSWVRSIIPEILWIGLIQFQHGHRRGGPADYIDGETSARGALRLLI